MKKIIKGVDSELRVKSFSTGIELFSHF